MISATPHILLEALKSRDELAKTTECLRLFDGVGDGLTQLIIEKLKDVIIVQDFSDGSEIKSFVSDNLPLIIERYNPRSIYYRRRTKASIQEDLSADLMWGESTSEIVVREGPASFIIRPERAANGGLFLDTRDLRSMLQRLKTLPFLTELSSYPIKVLNTFAYTGSLGISALLGGASEVVQVDANKSILNWARDNFEVNKTHINGQMKCVCEDTYTFLKRDAKRIKDGKKEPYEVVILDPPTFGRSKRGSFSLIKDLSGLVAEALSLVRSYGIIIVSVNNKGFTIKELIGLIGKNISQNNEGLSFRVIQELKPSPRDFKAPLSKSNVMRGAAIQLISQKN